MDKFTREKLWTEQGWNVIVVWECGLKTAKDLERTFAKVARWLAEFESCKFVNRSVQARIG